MKHLKTLLLSMLIISSQAKIEFAVGASLAGKAMTLDLKELSKLTKEIEDTLEENIKSDVGKNIINELKNQIKLFNQEEKTESKENKENKDNNFYSAANTVLNFIKSGAKELTTNIKEKNKLSDILMNKSKDKPFVRFLGIDAQARFELRKYFNEKDESFSLISILKLGSTQEFLFGGGARYKNFNIDLALGAESGHIPLLITDFKLGAPNFSGLIKLDYFVSDHTKIFIEYQQSYSSLYFFEKTFFKTKAISPMHKISFGVVTIIDSTVIKGAITEVRTSTADIKNAVVNEYNYITN